ncbi:hypothetical protein [Nocardiopsis lucentensis]|uniref:hypothetical protein n=1 Tax=Nocardiopsis lucentensis TaxID=53441 RepID=UPI000346684E|nr:hypothetical protein [Nocardiopsis lucentensis]
MAEHVSFVDYLAQVYDHLATAKAMYERMLAADTDTEDVRAELSAAMGLAGVALARGSAQDNQDAVALSRASRHDMDPFQAEFDVDLLAAIAADVDAGLGAPGEAEVGEPDRDARCMRDVAAAEGDLLAGDSLWWETSEAEDRQGRYDTDHWPFPVDIDPDEEKPW